MSKQEAKVIDSWFYAADLPTFAALLSFFCFVLFF